MMWSSSPRIWVPEARQYGHTAHTILISSSWVWKCIMEVGMYNVDGMLGVDPKELYLIG